MSLIESVNFWAVPIRARESWRRFKGVIVIKDHISRGGFKGHAPESLARSFFKKGGGDLKSPWDFV